MEMLPNNVEIEQRMLSVIISGYIQFDKVAHILHDGCFYNPQHKDIFNVMLSLYKKNSQIDIMTVRQESKSLGIEIELKTLVEISAIATFSAHITDWCAILNELYIRRSYIQETIQNLQNAYSDKYSIEDLLIDTEKGAQGLYKQMAGDGRFVEVYDGVYKSAERLAQRAHEYRTTGRMMGISSGIHELDQITTGWKSGELVILAGRPAMGKTAIMLHLAKTAAKTGKHVLLFSLEMSKENICDRFLLSESEKDVSSTDFNIGSLSEFYEDDICNGAIEFKGMPVYIDDTADVTIDYIKAKSKVMKDGGRCDFILVDYLQLIREGAHVNRGREQAIAAISRQAKILAKELGVPVIMLSQLSRAVESRSDKMPMLSDLRDSGAIEQDADKVIFIYRPSYYMAPEDYSIPKDEGKLIVAKNREGRCGEAKFRHNTTLTKIIDL